MWSVKSEPQIYNIIFISNVVIQLYEVAHQVKLFSFLEKFFIFHTTDLIGNSQLCGTLNSKDFEAFVFQNQQTAP